MIEYQARPCTQARAEHAEGPSWDGAQQDLLWVDIYGHRVLRASPVAGHVLAPGEASSFDIGRCVSAVVPLEDPDAGHLIADELGVAHLPADGRVAPLVELEPGGAGRIRMNDAKCDPQGRLWAGSMAHDKAPGAASLYRIDPDLSVTTAIAGVTISNGLAWTRDAATMYYIDTPRQRVDRLRLTGTGDIAASEVSFEIPPSEGAPDGMAMDEEGCLWVALWGGWQVVRFSPAGEKLARVAVDAERVSSCAFGGPDGRTLFITTSQEDMTAAERDAQPHAGKLFAAEVDPSGPPADRFAGSQLKA